MDAVEETLAIDASPTEVWQALVDRDERRSWWSYLELDPVAGGRFTERWTTSDGEEVVTSGAVLELEPERLLRLTWADQDWVAATEVAIIITPAASGTVVTVRHTGWDLLPEGARLADDHHAGWRAHLANLRRHVEDHAV